MIGIRIQMEQQFLTNFWLIIQMRTSNSCNSSMKSYLNNNKSKVRKIMNNFSMNLQKKKMIRVKMKKMKMKMKMNINLLRL